MFYIYVIRCIKNNKVYVGQTNNSKRRKRDHFKELKQNIHFNNLLQEDYNEYGVQFFEFEILDECLNIETAIIRETYWIDYFGGIESDNVYNMQNKYSRNRDLCNRMSVGEKGKLVSIETRQKISKNRAKYLTEEHKQHIRDNAKVNPNYGMKGKHLTDKQKQHLSKIHTGLKSSMETCNKISMANRKYSEQFIQQLQQDYLDQGSYIGVAKKYKMNSNVVSRLIRFGTANCDKIYN